MPQQWPEMVFPAGYLRWHCSCADNRIGDEGMKAFSEALTSNSSLTSVNLESMPVRHHMNVRCMRLRLCCVALGPGPSMCRSSEDHVPSFCETQGHTPTSRARVCVYSFPPPSPSAAVMGAVDLGRTACGLPNSRTPTPPPMRRPRRVCVNHSSHAPRPCPPGTSALLSCCGGTRYPPLPPPPPPKRCRVHTEGVGGGGVPAGEFFAGKLTGF